MTIAVADAVMNGGTADDFVDSMNDLVGCILIPAMAHTLAVGSFRMTGSLTTAGATDLPCGSHHARG